MLRMDARPDSRAVVDDGDKAGDPVTVTVQPPSWAQDAYNYDDPASTVSLASDILTYRTLHGRTYHSGRGNAQYWGTHDAGHIESLDIMHHLYTLCLGDRLFLAPLVEPKKVVDVGTGTGIWAIDFADAHSDCQVIGIDIAPMQPQWVPPNLTFEIDDFHKEWTFPDNHFDFVHMRYLVGCVSDWTALFRQAFKCCQPGGWIESYESSPTALCDDDTLPADSAMAQWGPLFIEGGRMVGRSFDIIAQGVQRRAMEAAGFVDIQERDIQCPLGSWPAGQANKTIGKYSRLAITQDAEGFILFLANLQGWSRDRVNQYVSQLLKELTSDDYHAYYMHKIVWGRKPSS